MRTRRVVVIAALLVVACDSSDARRKAPPQQDPDAAVPDTGAPPDASPLPPETGAPLDAAAFLSLEAYCSQYGPWFHDYMRGCYDEEAYPDGARDAYIARVIEECSHADVGVRGGRLTYDGEQAAFCLQALATTTCYAVLDRIPGCDGVFTGTVPAGGTCYVDESSVACAAGLCLGVTCPAECVPYPAVGQPCLDFRCGPGEHCDADVCVARVARGAACDGSDCPLDQTCADAPGGRVCVDAVPIGAACGSAGVCNRPGVCLDGTCQRVVGPGDPCFVGFNCPAGTLCMLLPGEGGATCRPPVAIGGVCGGSDHCVDGAFCDGPGGGEPSTCQARVALGEICAGSNHCVDGAWCLPGPDATTTCTLAIPDGQPCTESRECAALSCNTGADGGAGTCGPPPEEPPGPDPVPCLGE